MVDQRICQFLKYLYLSASEESFTFDEAIDFELFYPIATKNRIANIMFYGLKNIKKENQPSKELYLKIYNECMMYGVKTFHQDNSFKAIAKEYKNKNIELTVVKGQVLKSLYLKPDMRVMGDIDFIVPRHEYVKARNILVDNFKYHIEHEDKDELCALNEQHVCVELHQHLATELSNNQKYFDKTYELHKVQCGDYYVLDDDYHFLYMMDHIYKHFVDGGLGLKYILDFALFVKKYPKVIENTFKELHKLKLANITLGFLQICQNYIGMDVREQLSLFDKEISEEATDKLLKLMIKNGEYGTVESRVNAKNVQGTFVKRMKKRLFPMVVRPGKNKVLECIIYPFRLIWFWICFVAKDTKYIIHVFKKRSSMSDEERDEVKIMFDELK